MSRSSEVSQEIEVGGTVLQWLTSYNESAANGKAPHQAWQEILLLPGGSKPGSCQMDDSLFQADGTPFPDPAVCRHGIRPGSRT